MEVELETIAFVLGLVGGLVLLGFADLYFSAWRRRRAVARSRKRLAEAEAVKARRVAARDEQSVKNYGKKDSGDRT